MRKKLLVIGISAIVTLLAIHNLLVYRSVRISVVGDILLDRGVEVMIQRYGPSYPYEKISKVLKQSDITVGNLEGPITESSTPALKKNNLIFRGDLLNLPYLYNAGFSLFNLANNHVMDYGPKGLCDTIELLNKAGINTFGAGYNKEKAEKPIYIHKNGIIIGFLGFSAFPPEGYFYFENRPDVAHLNEDRLRSIISHSKKECNVLVVIFHWGKEFDFYPSEHQKTVAHMACESGADIVIGHHPHVLQGIEKYKGKYIFYSLGNFVFDKQVPKGTDQTGVLQFTVNKQAIQAVTLLPIKIIKCQPTTCNENDAQYITKRLNLYSKGIGTVIEYTNNLIAIH
jgi:gamma-polyglutamate biosynthesis protein CapA